jgi:hypothetical protein
MGNLITPAIIMDHKAIPIAVAVTPARSTEWVECWRLVLAAWSAA